MSKRLTLALLLGALVAPFSASAQIFNNFGGAGTVRSGFTTGQSTTTSKEESSSVKQVYGGSAYTVTGSNVTAGGDLGPDQTYQIATPGAPFQFSTTYQEPGLTSVESGGRTVTTQTLTNTLSVFSEVQ